MERVGGGPGGICLGDCPTINGRRAIARRPGSLEQFAIVSRDRRRAWLPPGNATCDYFDVGDEWSWVRGWFGDTSRILVSVPGHLLDIDTGQTQFSAADRHARAALSFRYA